MSLNRAPFDALVDDDGTGLTGTTWNKTQIKNVLLDPIDVELAKGAAITTGTWTPSLGGTTTYQERSGVWLKIGPLVFVRANLYLTALGTGSASTISGLVHAALAPTPGSIGAFIAAAKAYTYVGCYVSGSTILMTGLTTPAATVENPTNFFGNGTYVDLAAVYMTS